jgi:hypothetical protein
MDVGFWVYTVRAAKVRFAIVVALCLVLIVGGVGLMDGWSFDRFDLLVVVPILVVAMLAIIAIAINANPAWRNEYEEKRRVG